MAPMLASRPAPRVEIPDTGGVDWGTMSGCLMTESSASPRS
jgi:hypothetical protein